MVVWLILCGLARDEKMMGFPARWHMGDFPASLV